jgi:hypothetical protein
VLGDEFDDRVAHGQNLAEAVPKQCTWRVLSFFEGTV